MTRLTRQGSSDIWRRLQRLVTRNQRAPQTHATQPRSCRPTAVVLAILAATVALTLAAPASAQEARGTIAGTIRDASGSVIPGATVTITNKEMGTTVTVVTNEVGFYQVPYLIPGTYQVDAELQGFKKAAREVEVRIADRLEVDLSLAVGETVESVTVTADTPLLETTNGSLGNVVDSRRIAQLPTPHGDPYALIGLAAGVTYTGSARLDRPFEPTHIVGYSMDGTRGNRSDLTIDGVPSTATANAGEVIASYVPPADIVQEFKVQTATFDASTGNTEGGVANLMIKSGTNTLRGTAYIAKTPGELFANDFFANANNIPLAPSTTTAMAAWPAARWCCPATTAAGRRSSCTASRASTSRGPATTARRRSRPRRCAPVTSRNCSRSGRSIRSTTRSRGARSPAGDSSRTRSPATSSRRT